MRDVMLASQFRGNAMRLRQFGLMLSAVACLAPVGCLGRVAHNLPPSQRLMEPGPGVGGPGPGVIQPAAAMMPMGPGGGMGGPGGMMGPGCGPDGCGPGGPGGPGGGLCGIGGGMSQIAFLGVEGAEVAWDVSGNCMFDSTPLVMPGRQNFSQAAIYRIKLTNIPDRPGVELYPTLEVAPVTPRTNAYLAHSPIPIQFTDEDLDQVLAGNFVTKVIYLPDPEFQELALAGVQELVSTRLDPGTDPIAEADRRGAILAILRVGNLDLQMPGQMVAMNGGDVEQAQYYDGQEIPMEGGQSYGGGEYCPPSYGSGAPMGAMGPQGMSTTGFAPQVAPPGYISGVNGPQYGMPMTGTPIGLPGPPHIPLGVPAGLTSHTIKNKTRVVMPPPVHNMKVTVKQRPGMNYPRPVNHVKISETNRAPFKLFGGTVPPLLSGLGAHKAADDCYEECPE
jgi:hypothetical protein